MLPVIYFNNSIQKTTIGTILCLNQPYDVSKITMEIGKAIFIVASTPVSAAVI